MRNFILNWKDCDNKEDRQYCQAERPHGGADKAGAVANN